MDDVVTTAATARPLESGAEVRQFQMGQGRHDGTQYNFFAEDKIFSVRVMDMQDLKYHNVWLYDDGLLEIINSNEPWELSGDSHLDMKAPRFELSCDDDKGSLVVLSEQSEPVLEIAFTTPISAPWGSPAGSSVIHQPLIQADISYDGHSYKGIGYSKRYWFVEPPHFWSWRFINGAVDDGRYMIWTADAQWGEDAEKYDYFRIAYPDGTVLAAENIDSYHRDNAAHGVIDGTAYEVQIDELCEWSGQVRHAGMDTKLRQRFCKMRVIHDGEVDESYALNETGMGTIR